ncbi:MAG: hypothetical protein II503_02415, partial [Clostridia bacterium]|nr:hypothetical protein [Clostridia bacterium]
GSTKETELNKAVLDRFNITGKNAVSEIEEYVSQWKYDVNAKVQHQYDVENSEKVDDIDERALSTYRTAMSYAKSASSARNVDNYIPYTDQLRNVTKELKQFVMAMGGLRKHSSNDFRIDYVQDYFMLFADMAAGEWTGHTYTKSTDYVKIFGRTGDRINMSVAFETRGGKVYENVLEGMPWADAKKLRHDYYDNVGVMAMVTSNAQLSYALNADWIDMIIPFHASGMKKAVWYNMKAWQDFTSKQNERFKTRAQMESELKEKGVSVPSGADASAVRKLYDEEFGIRQIYKDGKRVVPHFLPGEYEFNGQTIPGHHNDYDTYMELCRQYGVKPRFEGIKVKDADGKEIDVTKHPNYFRLIKETARTETEQKPIKFNFDEQDKALGKRTDGTYMTPMEYAMERMEQEAKNGGYSNLSEDPYGVIPEFVENYLGKDVPLPTKLGEDGKPIPDNYEKMLTPRAKDFKDYLFENQKAVNEKQEKIVDEASASERSSRSVTSEENARYMELAKDPAKNKAELQKMVDDAAKDAGYTVNAYHGTDKNFTVFMRGKEGIHFGTLEQAIDRAADQYYQNDTTHKWSEIRERFHKGYESRDLPNGRIIEAYVSANSPLVIDFDVGEWSAHEIAGRILEEASDGYYEDLTATEYDKAVLERLARENDEEYAADTLDELYYFLRGKGYDSIKYLNEFEGDGEDYSYILFDPNQIKSADPVTYDDSGNVIPLSERFNENEEDIRYSKSIDTDSLRKPTDLVELNDKQLSNREKTENNTVVGSALYTLGGNVIKRFRNVVGKNLGTDKSPQVYLHKSAVDAAEKADILPRGMFEKADALLREQRPDFSYNAIMYDAKNPNVIRFDEAPNFDTEREPVVGWQVKVDTENGTVANVSKTPSKTIWHHKWNWVTDDYDG